MYFLKKFFSLHFIFFVSIFSPIESNRIVNLTPPLINEETIAEKIVCTRPARKKNYNISCAHSHDKMIVHCYGHGGTGWTTLFGSVNKAIQLFVNENIDPELPIRVIGSGCMGLVTALELKRLGYKVTGISTKELYNIPSWKAAGYFSGVVTRGSKKKQAELDTLVMETFLTFKTIDEGKHSYIGPNAVCYMPVYCPPSMTGGFKNLELNKIIPEAESVTLDFGNGTRHKNYVKYMTYFMNTTILMHQLIEEVIRLDIPITVEEIQSFENVSEPIIFNCSGLGSKELNHDNTMFPVRGHLITLNEHAGTEHMKYMICTKVVQNGTQAYVYMFPKDISVTAQHPEGLSCFGILGGTFIPHVDDLPLDEQEILNKKEFELLIERQREFFGYTKKEV